jgi:hypothetical protein
VLSHKTHVTAGHHAATGHPGAHLPVVRHPRPAAHHAPVAPPDSGACGVSDITRKLHANGATGLVGPLSGAPASGLAVGGLAIGGTMVGIGGAAVLAPGGPPPTHGGAGGPGLGGPGFGGPGFGGPGVGGPGAGGPGFGGPHGPLTGTPTIAHAPTPPSPVRVPEPSRLLVLAAALLALMLIRWTIARR